MAHAGVVVWGIYGFYALIDGSFILPSFQQKDVTRKEGVEIHVYRVCP